MELGYRMRECDPDRGIRGIREEDSSLLSVLLVEDKDEIKNFY